MASNIMVHCFFGGDNVVFVIDDGASYENLCYVIRSKFFELGSFTFHTKYDMPSMDQYDLCNDEDMKIVLAFMLICDASHVDIIVTSTGVTTYNFDIEIPIIEPEVEPLLKYETE